MDKLLFIYINSRTLRQASGEKDWDAKLFNELDQELLLNIEDDIVQEAQDDDIQERINQFKDVFMSGVDN
jgi:hypothetical protein